MNCIICNSKMDKKNHFTSYGIITWKCSECTVHFRQEIGKPDYFWFIEWLNNRHYIVRYYIGVNMMSVLDGSMNAGLPVIFKISYTKPILTPNNIKDRLPTLITFS